MDCFPGVERAGNPVRALALRAARLPGNVLVDRLRVVQLPQPKLRALAPGGVDGDGPVVPNTPWL